MKLTKLLCALLMLISGCTVPMQHALPDIIKQMKQDPATLEFTIVAPGYTVQFKRFWPTNAFRGPVNSFQYAPGYHPTEPTPPDFPPLPFQLNPNP